MTVEEWLDEAPDPSDVLCLNEDGTGKYIPYEKIVENLYYLCGHNWSTTNLQVSYVNLPDRRTLISGTIEVEVEYLIGKTKVKRRLAGGANFICNATRIPHTTASVKSLAIMSTVKPLGRKFGWQLNEGEEDNAQELYGSKEAVSTIVSKPAQLP